MVIHSFQKTEKKAMVFEIIKNSNVLRAAFIWVERFGNLVYWLIVCGREFHHSNPF